MYTMENFKQDVRKTYNKSLEECSPMTDIILDQGTFDNGCGEKLIKQFIVCYLPDLKTLHFMVIKHHDVIDGGADYDKLYKRYLSIN